jgi:adenosylcobinamide-GDP ribazoletransferase
MLRSLIAAFLMYSRIPMPQIAWEEKNRRYALCFFPLIGAVIGGLLIGWYALSSRFLISGLLFGAVAAGIPVTVTGGIHLDGFCDVEDARASYAEKERRLAIMSDPHIGSFAVIRVVLHLLMLAACMANLRGMRYIGLAACVFCVSRTLSALAAVTLQCAKKDGTLQDFVKPAHKHFTLIWLISLLVLECAGMLLISPVPALVSIVLAGAAFAYYRHFSIRTFGGITGDTEGWFLQKCELWMLLGLVGTEVTGWF